MKISYSKLWKLLIDLKINQSEFRKSIDVAPNTMTRLRRDEEVSMKVLLKIATYLNCDISDICQFVMEDN